MCGRYTLKTDRKKLTELFGLDELPAFTPRYNLGPAQDGLILRVGDKSGTRAAAWLRWGLVPSWSKAGKSAPPLFNARSETIATKPTFRQALSRRRCLVVADGYYEWSERGTIKQPYYLTMNRGEPFAMAGLWDRWSPPDGAPEGTFESFTIITTAPNEVVAPMHDRMPVILDPDFFDDWLNPLLTDPHALQPLLKPYPGMRMFIRAVSSRVNNIKHDDPACLDPPGDSGMTPDRKPSPRSDRPAPDGQLDLGLDG